MKMQIYPTNQFNGEINAPSSKSYSHRAFFAACLSNGVSHILNPIDEGDVKVTIESLKSLGANLKKVNLKEYLIDKSVLLHSESKMFLDCKNSGTTIRFLVAFSIIYKGDLQLEGEFFLKKRPILPLLKSLEPLGISFKLSDQSLMIKTKQIVCKTIEIPGNISSQFISSLLFICPLIKSTEEKEIVIEVTAPIVSYPYIKISLDVLKAFGIEIYENKTDSDLLIYRVPLNQRYSATEYRIPGDFSSISFIIALAVLSPLDSSIKINNIDFIKPQGDKKLIAILREMGAQIEEDVKSHSLLIQGNIKTHPLKGIEIDVKDIPDLFPILTVIGAFSKGSTRLYNALNLRYKESDRIEVMAREMTKMGVKVEQKSDELIVHHCIEIKGIQIDHENDHRIAMALIIAALFAKSHSEIEQIEVINDSYPEFMTDLLKLGANIKIKGS
jgi:3-phosphoshikimate 1-carboxyvinyltransferase